MSRCPQVCRGLDSTSTDVTGAKATVSIFFAQKDILISLHCHVSPSNSKLLDKKHCNGNTCGGKICTAASVILHRHGRENTLCWESCTGVKMEHSDYSAKQGPKHKRNYKLLPSKIFSWKTVPVRVLAFLVCFWLLFYAPITMGPNEIVLLLR